MNPALPLTEPQERRLTVTLIEVERRLADLCEALGRSPQDLRLVRYEDRLRPEEGALLRERIEATQRRVRRVADTLGLEVSRESVRRGFVAGLEVASISLYEARPAGEMRGCGELDSATAAYLEEELPQLEALVREVIRALERG